MVLSRRLHAVQPQIIVIGCHVAQATCLKYLGVTVSSNLSWSANIHNTCAKARKQLGLLYQHFHCSAPAGLLCLCVGPPPHYLCQLTQGNTAKLATGLWFPGCQDPIQIMNWPPLACCMPKKAKSCCCANVFCLVVQSYHPQYSLLTPTLLPRSISVWHCIVLSQKHLPIFTPSSQVLSHYRTSCHLTSSLLTHKLC